MTNTQKRIERIIKKTQSEVHDMTNGFGIELDMHAKKVHRELLDYALSTNRRNNADAPVLVSGLSSVAVEGLLDCYPETTYQSVIASGKTWMLFTNRMAVEDMLQETDRNSGWADSRLSMAFDSVNRDLSPKQEQWIENKVLNSIAKTRRTLQGALMDLTLANLNATIR